MQVASILKAKGAHVVTVRPDETIQHAAAKLRLEGVGALIVSRDGIMLDGIITERDITKGFADHGADLASKHVRDLMELGVLTCKPEDGIADVARLMTNRRLRHLPVTDGSRLAGIVSVGDILKYRLDEVELEARVMQDVAIANRSHA
jgi:CBS domain-containing protein